MIHRAAVQIPPVADIFNISTSDVGNLNKKQQCLCHMDASVAQLIKAQCLKLNDRGFKSCLGPFSSKNLDKLSWVCIAVMGCEVL